jgi:hypothetical protein
LPKPLEQDGDGVEAVVAGLDAGGQGVELVGDAGLFVSWCQHKRRCFSGLGTQARHVHAVALRFHVFQEYGMLEPIKQVPVVNVCARFEGQDFCGAVPWFTSNQYLIEVRAQFAIKHVASLKMVIGAF